MVQHRPSCGSYSSRFGYPPTLHSDHWKLPHCVGMRTEDVKRKLETRRFYCPSSTERSRLIELFDRANRGFMSYDGCSVTELRSFANDRQLDLDISGTTKEELVQLLDQADEEATFDHFLDLPAELRARIYTFHIIGFDAMHSPTPPPITEVCQLVRKETLSLFYRIGRFKLELAAKYRDGFVIGRKDTNVRMTRPLSRFLSGTRKLNLQLIQRLQLHVNLMDVNIRRRPNYLGTTVWDLDLTHKDRNY